MGLWLNYTEIFPQKCPVWLLLPPQAASCPSRLLLSPQAPLPELSACSPWDPKSPQISTSGRSAPSQEAWPQLEDLEVSSWQALRHLGPRQGPRGAGPSPGTAGGGQRHGDSRGHRGCFGQVPIKSKGNSYGCVLFA